MFQNKILKVQKRDGTTVDFAQARITDAIFKALTATGQGDGKRAKKLSDRVLQILNRRFKKDEILHVEQIQDIVEEVLILEGLVEAAKAYILYREQRRRIREAVKVSEEAIERIDQYLEKLDWEVQENANMAFSLQGLNHYGVSYIVKRYWLNKIYPKEIREANELGDFHIHNLDTLGPYCAGWDLYDLLLKGFGGVSGKVESKPVKHFRTALGQVVNFLYTLQGEVAGAVAFSVHPKETIIVKDGTGNIQIERIGGFCDRFIEKNQKKEGEIEYSPIGDENLYTLSFNPEGKVEWKKIQKVIRHKINDPFRLIRTNKGHIHVSENHSIYSLLNHYYLGQRTLEAFDFIKQREIVPSNVFRQFYEPNGGVAYKKMMSLLEKKGLIEIDRSQKYVERCVYLTPKLKNNLALYRTKDLLPSKEIKSENVSSNVVTINKIELPETEKVNLFEIVSSNEYLASKFVVVLPKEAIEEVKKDIQEKISLRSLSFNLRKDHGYIWSLLNLGILDLSIYRKFVKNHPKGIKLKAKRARDKGIDIILKGKFLKNILKLMSWYISEGNKITDFQISISQNNPEKEKDIEKILKETKGIVYFIQRRENGVKNYVIGGTLGFLINRLCGKYAQNKEIPPFVFNLSKKMKEIFIKELLKGDGHQREVGSVYTTTSNLLATGLNLLLSSLGKRVSIKTSNEENYEKKKTKYWSRYDLVIHQNKEVILPFGDLVSAVILENNHFPSQCLYEYDLSVEDNENFIGGVGLFGLHNSNFDTLLAPFIRYDNLNYQQVKQALQEFLFNMAIPTRVGFQTPFSNVTLDIKPSPVFAKQPVIIGGKPQDKTYEEFQEEMDIFNRAFYECLIEGDRNQRVFTFPIPTINITKDFDWENPVLDPMWEATAKYGVNYFANYINSDMKPEDIRSMCCRLRIDLTELYNRGGGGLFGAGALTGSIGVVTIGLPRIGYLSKTKKEFFERLGRMMDLAKESLEIKRKVIENFIEKGLYPYSRFYLSGVKKMRGQYYGNHFSTIGLVGMNEALLNFIGENITSRKGRNFALEILDFMREKLVKYQKETGNIYNLEATPAESTTYRLAQKDKEKYPDIITAGTKEVPYYTNSTHLPVNYTDDLFEALTLQDELQCEYSGGTVLHFFLGEKISDPKMIPHFLKRVFEKFHLPYVTFTPTFSICPNHGYLEGEYFECPKCTIKQPCEVYSRIVGYLRPVQQWNLGKKEEFRWRREYRTYKEEKVVPLPKEKIPAKIRI